MYTYIFLCMLSVLLAVGESLRMVGTHAGRLTALTAGAAAPERLLFELLRDSLIPVSVFLMVAPVLSTVLDGWSFASGHPIKLDGGLVSVVLGLVGALGVLAGTVVRGIEHRHRLGFWRVGELCIMSITACMVIAASVSHLAFTLSPGNGVVNMAAGDFHPKDLHCNSDMILIRWNGSASSPVEYRCPGYLLNGPLTHPFAPWPDYTQGTSADLAVQLNQFVQDAQKHAGMAEVPK